MKLLTKEQEQAHYNETLKGGTIGGLTGLGLGTAGVVLAARRYAFFRSLTLPLRAFLVTSAGTFGGIISADHWSRAYEKEQNPIDREFKEREKERQQAESAGKNFTQRAMEWGKQERYKIVGASWLASMAAAFSLVNRNPYLTGQQKLVQARVYAQFLTLGVLIASAAFEISDRNNETGRYETVRYVDPKDPEHKRMIERQQEVSSGDPGDELWKDMVKAEEERMKQRHEEEAKYRKAHHKKEKKTDSDAKKSSKDDDHKKDSKKSDKDSKDEDDSESESEGEDEQKDKKEGKENKEKKSKK